MNKKNVSKVDLSKMDEDHDGDDVWRFVTLNSRKAFNDESQQSAFWSIKVISRSELMDGRAGVRFEIAENVFELF